MKMSKSNSHKVHQKRAAGKNGKIDHKSLPDFVRVTKTRKDSLGIEIEYEERNLGNQISVNVKALQQLIEKIEFLETELENKMDK